MNNKPNYGWPLYGCMVSILFLMATACGHRQQTNVPTAAEQPTYSSEDYAEPEDAEEEDTITYSGFINGHEYVDLGLPSGVLWATCNVGASDPSRYGSYYVWGVTTEQDLHYGNHPYPSELLEKMTDISGNIQYDAARANWGANWRMPTTKEMNELVEKCTWTWTERENSRGYQVTGPNGQSIFLPATGYKSSRAIREQNVTGRYRCSTPRFKSGEALLFTPKGLGLPKDPNSYFRNSDPNPIVLSGLDGCSIRPVSSGDGRQSKQHEEDATAVEAIATTTADPVGTGTSNGHAYVDLGLSSGVKWATCNVGASSMSDNGDYYAWGETEVKEDYTKENGKSGGKDMRDITGNAQHDAARAKWGGRWRMPTKREIDELKNGCRWSWASHEGRKGYQVTGPNGQSIFLPAAGYREGTEVFDTGVRGFYWISMPNERHVINGQELYFESGYCYVHAFHHSYGLPIRPVIEDGDGQTDGGESDMAEEGIINGHTYVDLGLTSGVKWATCNLGASSPFDYGDRYAWGMTFATNDRDYISGGGRTGKKMGDISGNREYDAARANWGGRWRMPTHEELDELIKECTWTWMKEGRIEGYRLTGRNGRSIFLPAPEYVGGQGQTGDYWSSTPYEEKYDAYYMYFREGRNCMSVGKARRDHTMYIRPVIK